MADCGLCILGDGTHDLQNGDAKVSGGNIHFNGNVDVKSNGLVATDGTITVEGTASGPLSSYDPDPLTQQAPIVDPLAAIPLPPDFSGLSVKSDPCGTGSGHGPGRYNGIKFPNGTCTLQPGVYIITGEWSFTGNSGLDATSGVTLYFMCGTASAPVNCATSGEAGGWLNAHGNGDIKVTAPSTGPTKGLALVYDRQNTEMIWLTGNGASRFVGTIYAPSASMDYRGNGCSTTFDSLIVVWDLTFSGNNACLKSNYLEAANIKIPPGGLHLSK